VLINHLKSLLEGSGTPHRMKLILLGQEKSGKTSLVKQLLVNQRSKQSHKGTLIAGMGSGGIGKTTIDEWTFSCNFENKDVTNHPGQKQKQQVTLSMWDFDAQG